MFIQLGFIREHSDQASESNKEKQGCQGAFDNQEIIFELAEPPSASELGTMEDGIISNKNRCFLSETSIMGGGNVPDGKSDSEYDEEDDGMDRIKEADAQTTAREKREKELQMAWPYIVAMLTNLGCLSIERIYMMLRMFMQGSANSPLGCSKDELREFLERRVRQGQITSDSGVYKLTARGND
ncbi:unnamed protein product [Protopolystoma xenopodis]|uniref:Anaphase-promoting complex subunit 2 C-terminal domain-containing protein n=1 Tax=Protopolystoma xenopodis TaxID=117903 RepID=A0A3S5FE67_9PLAT|nr:unnamed protein product [Protopolystoma xenopodis]